MCAVVCCYFLSAVIVKSLHLPVTVLHSLLKAELTFKMKSIKPIAFPLAFKVKHLSIYILLYPYYILLLLLSFRSAGVRIPTNVLFLFLHASVVKKWAALTLEALVTHGFVACLRVMIAGIHTLLNKLLNFFASTFHKCNTFIF